MNKKKDKNFIMFIPSIEDGGVEKNFFLINNFLIKKFNKLTLITISKDKKKNLINLLNLFLFHLTSGKNLGGNLNTS